MISRPLRPPAPLALAMVVSVTVLVLFALHRPLICTCGTVSLWGEVGPRQSQMLADWYSPSHVVHGLLFYLMLHLAAPRWRIEWRFVAALVIEAGWEIAENTPLIIDRYRAATIALGYSGDSILNSASDIVMMAVGFLAARRLPLWASLALVLVLELAPLVAIRDNFTLNIVMLLAPLDAVRAWQAG